jgi:hypothetical protein
LWATTSISKQHAPAKEQQEMHHNPIRSCVLASNKRILATGHDNGEVRTWDTQSGKELKLFLGHDKCVENVTFSPDLKVIASASDDKTVRLWDTQTSEELQCFQGHKTSVKVVSFSPDAMTIASGSACLHDDSGLPLIEERIVLRNAKTGKVICDFWSRETATSLAFSPDGKFVVSGCQYGISVVWDAQTGAEMYHFHYFGPHCAYDLTMSCTEVIATVGNHGWTVQPWDGESGVLSGRTPVESPFSGRPPRRFEASFDLKVAFQSAGLRPAIQTPPLRLNKDGEWIQQDGVDILWLPHQYRLCIFRAFAFGKTIVIPNESRGMAIFRLK